MATTYGESDFESWKLKYNVQGSAEKDRQVNWQAGVVPPTKASSVCNESYSNTPFVVLEYSVCGLRFQVLINRGTNQISPRKGRFP